MTLETYNWAIDKLLDAYNRKILFHGDCSACAVGTLLDGVDEWAKLFFTSQNQHPLNVHSRSIRQLEGDYIVDSGDMSVDEVEKLIAEKGLTVKELKAIEYAFETALHYSTEGYDYWANTLENKTQGQLMGLRAVLEVMKDMVEEETVDSSKDQQRLTEVYESRKVCLV